MVRFYTRRLYQMLTEHVGVQPTVDNPSDRWPVRFNLDTQASASEDADRRPVDFNHPILSITDPVHVVCFFFCFFLESPLKTSGSQMVINIHKNISEMEIGNDDLKSWVDIVGDL